MGTSTTTPGRRTIGLRRRPGLRLAPWQIVPLVIILAAGGWLIWQRTRATTSAAATTATAQTQLGSLTLSVTGSGSVLPARELALAFPVSGTVAEVLAAVGDEVTQGQPLARLDPRELELALRQAEANLKSAQARMAEVQGAAASALDLAAAQSQLASAQAGLERTLGGDVTAAEIAAAEASLRSAQASLAELKAGPAADTLASAQTRVDQARLTLREQRGSLAAAKLRAEGDVTTAATALRDAQEAYSRIYWENRQKEDSRRGVTQTELDNELAALRTVESADQALKDAQLALEQARQSEILGIQQAEASLRDAETQLKVLLAGPTTADIAQAESQVKQAQSSLDQLRRGASQPEVVQAQAQVDQARISLERLTAPGSTAEIASAEASLIQAQVAYEQAAYNLEQATLTAPFAGTISAVGLSAGASAGASTTVVLMDRSTLYVDLSLGETDTGRVAVGQPVTLTFDALPDLSLTGAVTLVAPAATVVQNVVTYQVRVGFDPGAAPVRVGMTASGTIVVEQRAEALLAPSRAIQAQGGAQVVQVLPGAGQAPVRIRVRTGETAGGQTEILSCVDTGALCLQPGDTLVIVATTTQQTGASGGFFAGPGGGFPGGGRP